MKDDERYPDLLKVPDFVIIKELRIELGKANAYILELEHKLKEKNKIHLKTEVDIRKNEHLKGLENKNKKLEEKNQSLKYEIITLKSRINNIHAKYNTL